MIKYPKEKYPSEVRAFYRLQARVGRGYTTSSWRRTTEDFYAFLKEVGPVPVNMKRPSVGRKDHYKGYVLGNCEWQETYDNVLDGCLRMGKNNKGRVFSKEHREKLSAAHIGQVPWSLGKKFSASHRKKISDAHKVRRG